MEPFCKRLLEYGLVILVFMISRTWSKCADDQIELAVNGTGNATRCCDTCKPGYGVSVKCSPGNNTECRTCFPGKTFQSTHSHNNTCNTCSTCGNNPHFVLHPCNVTYNTICECPTGSYYSPADDKCKFCNLCPAGWGASRSCSSRHNSECSQCANNQTYSTKLDPFLGCQPCAVCSDMEVTLRACSIEKDTICFSVHAGAGLRPKYIYNTSTPPVLYHDADGNGGSIIPVYCSLLGLVVVGLVGYVLYKHWRRLQAKRRHMARDPHEDVEYSKASGADSGVYVEHDSPKNYTYSMISKVRDLPHGKRKEIEKCLCNPHSDGWKSLAREIGYDNNAITQFEVKTKGGERNSGFKRMIHDWKRQNVSTIGNLMAALRSIGREDVARILYIDSTEGKAQMRTQCQNNNIV